MSETTGPKLAASGASGTESEVLIQVQPTPNPNAWKFILDRSVLSEGKATYSTAEEAFGNRLATDLLEVNGVRQVHFFQNVITITARFDVTEEDLHPAVVAVIRTRLPVHNPDFGVTQSKAALRANLPPEIQQIETILDNTIRPGLQGDGGDIELVKLDGKQLFVRYQGACGTCPSSTSGTLMAIEGILREQFQPDLEVIPV